MTENLSKSFLLPHAISIATFELVSVYIAICVPYRCVSHYQRKGKLSLHAKNLYPQQIKSKPRPRREHASENNHCALLLENDPDPRQRAPPSSSPRDTPCSTDPGKSQYVRARTTGPILSGLLTW